MNQRIRFGAIAPFAIATLLLGAAPVFADTALTIQSLSSQSVAVGTLATFTAVPSGFANATYTYTVTDTDPDTTVTNANINAAGQFSWTPTSDELGLHTIDVHVVSGDGTSADVMQRIDVVTSSAATVSGTDTLTLSAFSPSAIVAPGTTITAIVTPSGFTPSSYYTTDTFAGTTLGYAAMNASGAFSWTPATSDIGVHTVKMIGYDVAGNNASVTATITVSGTPAVTSTVPVITTPVATAPAYIFTDPLASDSTGPDVLALQQLLVRDGFLSATPNGNYGPATTAAVKLYQSAHSIDALGTVGPSTRSALNAEEAVAATTATPLPASTVSSSSISTAAKQTLLLIAEQLQQLAAQLSTIANQ